MKSIINGNLRGFNCKECSENISGAVVKLYQPINESFVPVNAERLTVLSPQEIKAKSGRFIAETPVDDNGSFSFELSENYSQMSGFDIDFECGSIPRKPLLPKKGPIVQVHLGQFEVEWSVTERARFAKLPLHVPHKIWCYIKGKIFDVWTICGKLVNCDTQKPLAGVTITAMDADLITDDLLGTAITDSNGHFTIYYSSSDFRINFLPFHLETDLEPPYTSSGPDVYFKGHFGTTEIFNETSDLRRKNVPHCLCVTLCANSNIVNPSNPDLYSAWTRIGTAFNIPTGSALNDFDTDGFAGAEKFGFHGNIQLSGQAPHKNSDGDHIQYRFSISHVTTPNGGSAPAAANFSKIIGVTPGLLDENAVVCQLSKPSIPSGTIDVFAKASDFDSDGWFDINNAIQRSFIDRGIPVSDQNDWYLVDTDTLLSLNTAALTTGLDIGFPIAEGQPVPVAALIPIEKIAIRFEVRTFNPITLATSAMTANGRTLNSMVVNNNSIFAKYMITQLGIGGCSPLSGNIDAAYTVHHPLLRSASLRIRNNSGTVNRLLTDSFLTVSNNTNAAINNGNNPALRINLVPNDMPRCTYVLELDVQKRLHNGVSASHDGVQQIFFFYDPS